MQRRLLGLTDADGDGDGGTPPPVSPTTVTSHDVAAAEALAMGAMAGHHGQSDDGAGEMDVRAQLEMQSQIIALRRQLQTTRARGEEALSVREQHDETERKEAIRTLSARARRARLGIGED